MLNKKIHLKPEHKTKILRISGFAVSGIFIFFFFYPINMGLVRLILILSFLLLIGIGTALTWHLKKLRFIPLGLLIIAIIFLLLPGRPANVENIRKRYILALKKYEGVRYVWGGENSFGIDCSGLVRKGLLLANLKEGLFTLNPVLVRKAIALWWFDCTARGLKNHYRNLTKDLFEAVSINLINTEKLKPGDLAVTMDGVHVLVYLGNGEWIEADPELKKVFRTKVPAENTWFKIQVRLLRWKQLF